MRKLMVLMIGLAILLVGCSEPYPEELEAQLLYEHYQSFIQNDISTEERLQSFINDVSLTMINNNVIVEVKIYNQLNALLETRQSSGFIYQRNESNFDVITLIPISDINTSFTVQYLIKDVQGKSYEGQLLSSSDEQNLAIFRFSSTRLSLGETLPFTKIRPYIGEPLILIGHQFKIINSMSMGRVLGYEANESLNLELILSSITSDSFGNGGVILNMNKEIVGIQFENREGLTLIIQADTLIEFIESLT